MRWRIPIQQSQSLSNDVDSSARIVFLGKGKKGINVDLRKIFFNSLPAVAANIVAGEIFNKSTVLLELTVSDKKKRSVFIWERSFITQSIYLSATIDDGSSQTGVSVIQDSTLTGCYRPHGFF